MEQENLEKLTVAEKKIAFERQREQRLKTKESLLSKQTELHQKIIEKEIEELRLNSENAKEEKDRAKKAADFKFEQEMERSKMELEQDRKDRESRRKIAESEAILKCTMYARIMESTAANATASAESQCSVFVQYATGNYSLAPRFHDPGAEHVAATSKEGITSFKHQEGARRNVGTHTEMQEHAETQQK